MGQTEEANPLRVNLLEGDPSLIQRVLWRRRPPTVMSLADEALDESPLGLAPYVEFLLWLGTQARVIRS
jgi:hypothetical protein